MTWEQAQQDFADGLLTKTGLVYAYFACRMPKGAKRRIHGSQVYQELGISKTTYYRAIATLVEAGRLTVEDDQMTIGIPASSKNETPVPNLGIESQIWENRSPELAPCKDSSDPTDLLQISYRSLSLRPAPHP
jgi:hypothetical protein